MLSGYVTQIGALENSKLNKSKALDLFNLFAIFYRAKVGKKKW